MSEPAVELTTEEKRKARQAKLLAKGAARLEKITGAAGADRIVSADSSEPPATLRTACKWNTLTEYVLARHSQGGGDAS